MATTLAVGAQNKVLASTLENWLPTLGMNVYNATPILDVIMSKGNKKKWIGEAQRVPIVNATYTDAIRYTDYDTIAPLPQEPFTVADYEMAGYGRPVTIAGMQRRKNQATPTKMFDILQAEVKLAMQAMRNAMATDIVASTNVSKGILSLDTLTDATTTIAGVAGSSVWGGTTTASGSFAAQGKSDLMTMRQTLAQYASIDGKGGDDPDYILTTQNVEKFYWASLEGQIRYVSGEKADPNLKLEFFGMPVVSSTYPASGRLYMVNAGHLYVWVHGDADFTVGDWEQPIDQDAFSKKILWNGAFGTDARRYHGKLTGITA